VLEPEAPSSRHSSPVKTQHRQLPDEEQGGVGDEGKSDLASLAEVSGGPSLNRGATAWLLALPPPA
jgi:hypothetical protein